MYYGTSFRPLPGYMGVPYIFRFTPQSTGMKSIFPFFQAHTNLQQIFTVRLVSVATRPSQRHRGSQVMRT